MPIARIEPTGCVEFHGNVQTRLAFFLEPEDARYDECRYLASVIPPEGYPGEVDTEGNPVSQADYNAWIESLPKKWVLAPFHNHFLYLPPDVNEDTIIAKANFHLPNFYAAWLQELDKIKGGMRKGWATETRVHPIRYDKVEPELYDLKKQQCLEKVALIKKLPLAISSKDIGEIFPATVITIGAAAIDRATSTGTGFTSINKENPANDNGSIDTTEVWVAATTYLSEVATMEEVSGDTFTSRDNETIGTVNQGAKRTFTGQAIDVQTGDYYGFRGAVGEIERDGSGGDGIWKKSGDYIPCTNEVFSFESGETISLYGTGETAAVGIADKSANMGAKMIAAKLI